MLEKKGVSIVILIILLVISAIIGGIITYMFTIAAFIEVPEETAISITGVYINTENTSSFKIGVINPSYSPTNATVTRLAISLKEASQLYDVVETEPVIGNGITIPRSTSLNITCFKIRKDGINITSGEFFGLFAGETINLHVFSSDAVAANIEKTLSYIKLNITKTDFNLKTSSKRFNITVMNQHSEINLTITGISALGINITAISPLLPKPIVINESIHFMCEGNWYGQENTTLKISTKESYFFSKELALPTVYTEIQNVTFNENNPDFFNVTVFNFGESASYVNITKIVGTIDDEMILQKEYPSIGIMPNSTFTFKVNWLWEVFRGANITLTVYLLQDFKTNEYIIIIPL